MAIPGSAALSVRAKIQLLLFAVILSVGLASIHYARREMSNTLGRQLERRGQAIAEDLAAGTADLILTGDLIELNRWVRRAKANDQDVRYIMILGPHGNLILSTFGGRPPAGLREANSLTLGRVSQKKRIQTEEGLIRDFAVPVLGGQAGTVRVGMSDQALKWAVARHSRILSVLIFMAAAFGLMASYWLASYITQPLSNLASAVRLVGQGDLGHELEPQGNDEIGRLTQVFNGTSRALADKEKARQALLAKVITSQEDERKRLARDLHDEVVQLLISAQLTLDALSRGSPGKSADAPDYLSLARQVVAQALAETRRLIYDLRPTILDQLGLGPAIEQFAQARLGSMGITVDFQAHEVPDRLNPLVETAVFRIVQEACTNVAKYAGASAVRISLRASGGLLTGEVADDGAGFDMDRILDTSIQPASGLGIQGMRERANLLGGTVDVRSAPEHGTIVTISVPFDPASEELQIYGQDHAVAG